MTLHMLQQKLDNCIALKNFVETAKLRKEERAVRQKESDEIASLKHSLQK